MLGSYPTDVYHYFCDHDFGGDDLFCRFGNFKALLISLLIGGGFWDEPEGQSFASFLNEKYGFILAGLAKEHAAIFEMIKLSEFSESAHDFFTIEGRRALNDELISAGAPIRFDSLGALIPISCLLDCERFVRNYQPLSALNSLGSGLAAVAGLFSRVTIDAQTHGASGAIVREVERQVLGRY